MASPSERRKAMAILDPRLAAIIDEISLRLDAVEKVVQELRRDVKAIPEVAADAVARDTITVEAVDPLSRIISNA